MGKRGPKNKPTILLKARGSRRVKDRPKNEPVPAKGLPSPPEWLKGEGLKEWYRWAKLLFEQGTLNLIDANILGYYCDAHADFLYAKELCATKGGKTSMVIKTTNGNIITSPAYAIKRHARAEAARLAAELGMSPAGRTEINLPKMPDGKEDSSQNWLSKHNQGA